MKETLHVTGAAFRNIPVQEKGPQWLCCLQLPVLRDLEPHRSFLFDWLTKPTDCETVGWPKRWRFSARGSWFLLARGGWFHFGQMVAERPLGKKAHLCNLAQQVSLHLPLPFWLQPVSFLPCCSDPFWLLRLL